MTEPLPPEDLAFVYGGDRDIGVRVLKFILEQGALPKALILPSEKRATHDEEIRQLCSHLPDELVLRGTDFRNPEGVALLETLDLDYIICIHIPYIVPKQILEVPRVGVLNLHPAMLPYSRGWHPSIWALLDQVPYGATLHFMDENLDTGDVIHQKEIQIQPHHTADDLYKIAKEYEFEVFSEAWPRLLSMSPPRQPQNHDVATFHLKKDLIESGIQKLDLKEQTSIGSVLSKLRALTTNALDEAAYFEVNGERYSVQVRITPDNLADGSPNS